MPRQIIEIAVASLIFVISGFGLRQGLAFPGRSSYLPVATLGLAMILCCIWVVQSLISLRRERRSIAINPMELKRLVIIGVFGFIYVILIPVLGFFSATTLFTPVTAFCLGFRRWKAIALTTVAFVAVLYIVFGYILKTPLPSELIGQLIESA
jgi:hypothetical protein